MVATTEGNKCNEETTKIIKQVQTTIYKYCPKFNVLADRNCSLYLTYLKVNRNQLQPAPPPRDDPACFHPLPLLMTYSQKRFYCFSTYS